jgi:hypothetical protein
MAELQQQVQEAVVREDFVAAARFRDARQATRRRLFTLLLRLLGESGQHTD